MAPKLTSFFSKTLLWFS